MQGSQQVRLMSEMPIYLAAKDLAVRVLRSTQHFPRQYKYTVGGEMHRASMAVLTHIAHGVVTKDRDTRIRAIEQFQAEFQTLKTLIEISFEARWINQATYAGFLKVAKSIGAQGSAWKSAQTRSAHGQNYQG